MDYQSMPLRASQDALEGHLDSSRVARLARRILRYPHLGDRTVAAWLTVSYTAFLAEVALYEDLAQCGPQTYAEWQVALECLVDGDPPSQGSPYAD